MKIKHKNTWNGTIDGVSFEIQNWKTPALQGKNYFYPEKENWTYYLYIELKRIPVEYNSESFWLERYYGNDEWYKIRACYREDQHPILSQIEFHGGITWYSKEAGFDDSDKIIKIGCDYGHHFDEGQVYTLEYVISDVENTIRSFKSLIPGYLYRCCGNGKFYTKDQGIWNIEQESFYSEEYWSEKEFYQKLKETE